VSDTARASAPARDRPRGSASPVAPLLWIELAGPEIDDEASELLARGVGGVILFTHNIAGAVALRDLIAGLRATAAGPLQVSIDHEGGHVARIGSPLTRFPSAMAIAATGSVALAQGVAEAAGQELATLGVDINLAPVLDVAADPRNPSVGVRSFGSDPDAVARFGAATVRGFQAGGVAAVAKHFPGHGRTPVDSHVDLPRVPGGIDELRATDLVPFRAAVEAGVDAVMVSHVAYDGLTGDVPASLSSAVMGPLLRDELGFRGPLMTDAMRMGAIANRHGMPEASVATLRAGADIVAPLADQRASLDALEAAAAEGVIPAARIAEARARVDLLHRRVARGSDYALPRLARADLAADVARRSLTLLADDLPLPMAESASVAVVEFASRRPSPVEESLPEAATLGEALRARRASVAHVLVRSDAAGAGRAAALAAAGAGDVVVVATRDAYLWAEERALVADLVSLGRPVILVALRNPYDVACLPLTATAVGAYTDVPATLEAVAQALTEPTTWPGRLPLSMPPRAALA
jgi:beta-N-acetylhexosaminidase